MHTDPNQSDTLVSTNGVATSNNASDNLFSITFDTLREGVEHTVKALCNRAKEFSAYDVSKALRLGVNQGAIHITELGWDTHGRVDIPHTDVRSFVQDMFMNDEFPQPYTREFRRNSDASYNVYVPNLAQSAQSAQSDDDEFSSEDDGDDSFPDSISDGMAPAGLDSDDAAIRHLGILGIVSTELGVVIHINNHPVIVNGKISYQSATDASSALPQGIVNKALRRDAYDISYVQMTPEQIMKLEFWTLEQVITGRK